MKWIAKSKSVLLLVVIVSLGLGSVVSAKGIDDILGKIPVQDGGRYKPFDTFARESLQLVYGRRDYKEKSATEIVMTWLLLPDHWDGLEFVRIDRKDLKEAMGLPVERSHFSPKEILSSERGPLLMQDLDGKRKAQEKLNPYWQAVQTLESQISLYKSIVAGMAMKLYPKAEGTDWYTLRDTPPEARAKFDDITKAFVQAIDKNETSALEQSVSEFIAMARAANPATYPSESVIGKELTLNHFHPFMWAWICYLVATLLFFTFILSQKDFASNVGLVAMIAGFLLHTYGFYLRITITGRPPVSNMYESVVWVSWGAVMFSFILERIQKKKYFLFASGLIAVVCLIMADIAPTVLDPSLQPLQPVLRSNMWLMIHVMTITLSYSAFFLAFVLGDIGLFYYLKGEEPNKKTIHTLAQAIYRAMQVGVVLLFAGTVLGGVWADYSWGRFWGWDPKETWAFIALMGYLAVLHGRLSGWLQNFGFTVTAVISFSLVIMAWYGVNFVLGAGLHSYGFGAGGVEYVAAFVGVHIAFAIAVITVRNSRKKHA